MPIIALSVTEAELYAAIQTMCDGYASICDASSIVHGNRSRAT